MATYKRDGYTVDQTAKNHHIWIFHNDKPVLHAQVDRELTEQELANYLDNYFKIAEVFDNDE